MWQGSPLPALADFANKSIQCQVFTDGDAGSQSGLIREFQHDNLGRLCRGRLDVRSKKCGGRFRLEAPEKLGKTE